MTLPLILVYGHLVARVLLVGYLLFWFIMTAGLERLEPAAAVAPLTGAMLAGARWPPAGVPWKLRLSLPGLGWALFAVMVATGLALYAAGPRPPLDGILGLKLVLLSALGLSQLRLHRRPTRGSATLTLFLALALVLASARIRR